MHYLGYLNTLGIKEVDYIIADRFTIPENLKHLYTEKLLYLDKGYQIFLPKHSCEITECPYKKNNYITFGSYNCTSKFSEKVLLLWSRILKEIPDFWRKDI